MLAEVTPRPGPGVRTGPTPTSPPPSLELSRTGAGKPDSSRWGTLGAGTRFRGPLSAAHPAEVAVL